MSLALTDNIAGFAPISLKEMDQLALMNRIDTKYLTSAENALSVLNSVKDDYKILEIDSERVFTYRNVYYDTPENLLLNEHLRGKLNRYKVRCRAYVASGISFLEVKKKTNKGRTIKSRIKRDGTGALSFEEKQFISTQTPLDSEALIPSLNVSFNRLTLASHEHQERVTFDFNLSFSDSPNHALSNGLSIIEVKRDSGTFHANFAVALKAQRIYPTSMSKYCLGMILTRTQVKHNGYKQKLLKLNKLSSHGNIW